MEAERAADRERNAVESKLEAIKLTSENRDGASALLRDSRGVSIMGSVAGLIEIDRGWEAAAAAALGNLADAVVVKDLSSAVTALTTLRRENLGQADVLVYEPGNGDKRSIPSGLNSLTNYVRSKAIDDLLSTLLSGIVVADDANAAEVILRNHPDVIVVTRDGDVVSKGRATGGSKSSSSLIEIKALISSLESKLQEIIHDSDRLKFEIASANAEVNSKQSDFDSAVSKLNESDARIAALTEQLAVSWQNMKSSMA